MSWATEDREREWRRSHEEDEKMDRILMVVIPIVLVLGAITFAGLLWLHVIGG